MKVLVFADWYPPAFKAGGPVRSIVNLIEKLKPEIGFYVYTTCYDLNETEPMEGIELDRWINKEGVQVYYRSTSKLQLHEVRKLIVKLKPDHIYLNSMFSDMLIPMLVAHASGKVIVAPRGMLMESALRIKPIKKYLYLWFLKQSGMASHLRFHATSEAERADIQRIFPSHREIMVAQNLPSAMRTSPTFIQKTPGLLHLVFVGRMNPIKNLHFLLECLPLVKGQMKLDIVASHEDETYLETCKAAAAQLPTNVQVQWHMDSLHDAVMGILGRSHLMVLPTAGENFGHAIYESLAMGCPVLISDKTPWHNLEAQQAGMDLPLGITSFVIGIQLFVDMADEEWQSFRKGALAMAADYLNSLGEKGDYGKIFKNAE